MDSYKNYTITFFTTIPHKKPTRQMSCRKCSINLLRLSSYNKSRRDFNVKYFTNYSYESTGINISVFFSFPFEDITALN